MASTPSLPHSPQPMACTERENGDGSLQILSNILSPGKTRKVLLSYDQLPDWHQDNEFILHGYRPISSSAWISFHSWFYVHNESINIYSHLIPAIIYLLGEWYILQHIISKYSNISSSDIFIFGFFLATAIICLALSATYHTLMNHSYNIERLWLQFDLVGIILLILGDFISGIYMIFWCEPLQRKIYWSMVSYYNISPPFYNYYI